MTREEAYNRIDAIIAKHEIDDEYVTITGFLDYDALRTAREILEQEPCEDAISRQAVIDEAFEVDTKEYGRIEVVGVDAIDALPPANPQPKTGQWEQYGNSWEDKFKCSECGKEQPKILCGERIIGHWSDYCPNCGAKMVEPQESEIEDGNVD